MTTQTFNINEINIHTTFTNPIGDMNEKIPIVFLHGMVCSAEVWKNQMDYFKEQHMVIAPDLRGHGFSSQPLDDDFSPSACAKDVLKVLEKLSLEKIILVGHSYGSLVAMATTADNHHKIEKLILIDPPVDSTKIPEQIFKDVVDPVRAAFAGDNYRDAIHYSFSQALLKGKPSTTEYINSKLQSASKNQLLGTSKELFTFRSIDTLDEITEKGKTPISLIVASSNNTPYSIPVLRNQIPVVEIPGTSHWIMLDEPSVFNQVLENIINNPN